MICYLIRLRASRAALLNISTHIDSWYAGWRCLYATSAGYLHILQPLPKMGNLPVISDCDVAHDEGALAG